MKLKLGLRDLLRGASVEPDEVVDIGARLVPVGLAAGKDRQLVEYAVFHLLGGLYGERYGQDVAMGLTGVEVKPIRA